MIYLAGPIDGVGHKEARDWREIANETLTFHHVATYSPAHAFAIGDTDRDVAEAIININNSALAQSKAVLANLGGVTFGTPIEVWDAVQTHKIPVFAFGLSSKSIYRHWIRAYDTMDGALSAILEEM